MSIKLLRALVISRSSGFLDLFRLNSLCMFFLASLSVQSVSAAEFYWMADGPGHPDIDPKDTHGEIPWLACQKRLDIHQNAYQPERNAHVVRVKYFSQDWYTCWMNYYWYDTRVGAWVLAQEMDANNFKVRRYGSSCLEESITNPTTGGCTIDEQKGPSNFCPSSTTGNPINFAIGNKFQAETDYAISGISSLGML